jgi:hypothetical protein
MLNCREVTAKIARDEFVGAPWRTRLAMRIHLILCRHCRRYSHQLRAIGEAGREVWGPPPQPLDSSERLERQILERSLGSLKDRDKIRREN